MPTIDRNDENATRYEVTQIDSAEATKSWRSAEMECRKNWAKAADLPPMPSELLLIAKDPLIGQALAKWGQSVCELVVGLRNELQRIRKAERPEEPEIVRLHRLNPVPAQQAHRVDLHHFHVAVAYIDALSAYADRMAAERDAAIRDIESGFMQGAYARLKRLQDCEAKLARVEKLLREPTKEMCEVGGREFLEARDRTATTEQMDAKLIFKAMTAELLRQIEGDK